MDWQEIVRIVVILIVYNLVPLFFKNFFPSYFNQKGKNLADKEDIEELTDKIENVKSSIDLLTSYKRAHRDEERNCLIEFYTELTNLVLVDNFKNSLTKEHANPEEQQQASMYAILRMQTKLSKVKLLVLDEEIIIHSTNLLLQGKKMIERTLQFAQVGAELFKEKYDKDISQEKIEIIHKKIDENYSESVENINILAAGFNTLENKFIDAVKIYLLK